MPTPKTTETPKIYQLKVTLKNVKPPIWRRFQVRSDVKLNAFHGVIQNIMGWENYHLHSFNARGKEYGEPDPEYGYEMLDERRVPLSQVLRKEGEKGTYLYDFGDGWEHTVLLEKILNPEPGMGYPVCLTGKRSCPPEDCGGPWGYADMLHTLNDPEDPEYEEKVEWIGGEFDPEAFDCNSINALLTRRVVVKKTETP